MSILDIKRKARRVTHKTMRIPANLYRGGDSEAEPELIYVRRHREVERAGDLAGTSLSYAEILDVDPKLIFEATDNPSRQDVVVFVDGEPFSIDSLEPLDDEFVTAVVKRMTQNQSANFEAPETS